MMNISMGDAFLNDMDNQQSVMYDDAMQGQFGHLLNTTNHGADQNNYIASTQSFTHQAITRQVNYVSEQAVDVDYSMFDKLQDVHQTA